MGKTKNSAVAIAVGRQAPSDVRTPDELLAALRSGSSATKRKAMRKAGIIDKDGKLTARYQNWGSKVTRTPNAD